MNVWVDLEKEMYVGDGFHGVSLLHNQSQLFIKFDKGGFFLSYHNIYCPLQLIQSINSYSHREDTDTV